MRTIYKNRPPRILSRTIFFKTNPFLFVILSFEPILRFVWLTKTQFSNPFSINSLLWAEVHPCVGIEVQIWSLHIYIYIYKEREREREREYRLKLYMEHGVTLNYVTTLNNFLLNSNLSLDWIFFSYTLHVWKNSRWFEINNYVIDQILKYINQL